MSEWKNGASYAVFIKMVDQFGVGKAGIAWNNAGLIATLYLSDNSHIDITPSGSSKWQEQTFGAGANNPGIYLLTYSPGASVNGVTAVAVYDPITLSSGTAKDGDIVANTEADSYGVLTDTGFGLAKLVRATTPATLLDTSKIDASISSRSTYAGGDTSGTTTLLTRVPGVVQPQTGDSYARLGSPVGASTSADIAAVKADTASAITKLNTLLSSPAITAAVNDPGALTTSFITTLSSIVNDFYAGDLLVVTSDVLTSQARRVISYNGTTKTVTLSAPLTSAPINGVTFTLIPGDRLLSDYLAALGTDKRSKISTDVHSSGVTVAAVLGLDTSKVDATISSRATPSDVTTARDNIKGASNIDLTQLNNSLSFVSDMTAGRWEIVNNQMLFYGPDNTTLLATYDLFNATGNPSMDAVFERRKV